MSNIRKSFSFREGVQVDNEVFVVRGALVGIGTTIPTEKLDISNGTLKVSGLVTCKDVIVSGVTTTSRIKVGSTVDISGTTGIITASKYYGDGSTLSNLPTSQWLDVDVGLGFTSIYAQGNVGVATNSPTKSLQIGGDPDFGRLGVGINSIGNVVASGVVTAFSFSGSGVGLTALNASNLFSGTVSNDRLPTIDTTKLPSDITVSGTVQASSFTGNLTGNVTGNVTGNLTGNVTGSVTGNTSGTSGGLSGTPSIQVGVLTAASINSTGVITSSSGINCSTTVKINSAGIITATRLEVSTLLANSSTQTSISTVSTSLKVGTGGTGLSVSGGKIGIGTEVPKQDVQILKRSDVNFEIISTGGKPQITIGNEETPSVGLGYSIGIIRFGNSPRSLDIVNNDGGNINCYLYAGQPVPAAGFETGRFAWIYGQDLTEMMSLTHQGRLGIGITDPKNNLHVVGTSTVTGQAYFGSDITVNGSIIGNLTGDITAARTYNTSGISTTYNLEVSNVANITSIGIGSTQPAAAIDAKNSTGLFLNIGVGGTTIPRTNLDVTGQALISSVGIGTTSTFGDGLVVSDSAVIMKQNLIQCYGSTILTDGEAFIGIGTISARCGVDLADASRTSPEYRYLLPPKITTTQRTGLSTISGAIIYNTTTNKHQGWNGTSWFDFY